MKFDLTNKWHMHNPESILDNETLLWDFEIQTNHQISARRPDLIIINNNKQKNKNKKNKRSCRIVDFAVPADYRVKLEGIEKIVKHETDVYTNCNWWSWYKDLKTWKLRDGMRLSKLLHCRNRPEYWEETSRLEKTCCYSNFNEKPCRGTFVVLFNP